MVANKIEIWGHVVLNLYQLKTFCTVLSEGSMTAAADKLFLTQPAVSQQIRNLEEDLGVELLVRGVRQVKPTVQGQLLYEYSTRILSMVQQAEVTIQTIGSEISGHLSVGTLNSIGLHLISPVVGLFLKHNADLKIRLEYNRAEEIFKEVKKSAIDVLVMPDLGQEYGYESTNLDSELLFKEEMWLVGPGKVKKQAKNISMKDFFQKSVVSFSGEYPGFNAALQQKINELGIKWDPVFESSNVGTLKRVIESGLGWGFLPSHSIRKQVRSGRLTRIHVEDFNYSFDMNYYVRQGIENKPVTDVFLRAIRNQIMN